MKTITTITILTLLVTSFSFTAFADTEPTTEPTVIPMSFVRGDVNQDNSVNIADVVAMLGYLFAQQQINEDCLAAVDINSDNGVNIADPVFILHFLFGGGVAPEAPYPEAGYVEKENALSCYKIYE